MYLIPLPFLITKNQLIVLQLFASKCLGIVNSEKFCKTACPKALASFLMNVKPFLVPDLSASFDHFACHLLL